MSAPNPPPERQVADLGTVWRGASQQNADVLVKRRETSLDSSQAVFNGADASVQVVDPRVETGLQRFDLGANAADQTLERPAENADQCGAEDAGDDLPDLVAVHQPRIVHAPRAVERHACNYGNVT